MSRELGSLGTVIGRAVAERLKYDYVYQEITSTAARDYEIVEENLIQVVEKAPRFLERLRGDFRRYQAVVLAQVFKTAERDNVVIIGRWSALMLREIEHAIRVRVTAPLEVRARRVMEMMQLGMERALEVVRENDMERGERMRQLYNVDWSAPHLYDLVLNTEKISVEAGADSIIQLAGREEFRATEASKQKLRNLALTYEIRAKLKSHRSTGEVDIDIEAADGHIILRGVVASDAEKRAVERLVRGLKGVEKVESHLRRLSHPVR